METRAGVSVGHPASPRNSTADQNSAELGIVNFNGVTEEGNARTFHDLSKTIS